MLNTDLDKITSSHIDDGLLHSLFHHIVGLRMGFKKSCSTVNRPIRDNNHSHFLLNNYFILLINLLLLLNTGCH